MRRQRAEERVDAAGPHRRGWWQIDVRRRHHRDDPAVARGITGGKKRLDIQPTLPRKPPHRQRRLDRRLARDEQLALRNVFQNLLRIAIFPEQVESHDALTADLPPLTPGFLQRVVEPPERVEIFGRQRERFGRLELGLGGEIPRRHQVVLAGIADVLQERHAATVAPLNRHAVRRRARGRPAAGLLDRRGR